MANRRRVAILFLLPFVVVVGLASTQVTAIAQGSGGFKAAGNYSNTSMLGVLNYNDPTTNTNVFLFANRQRTVGPAGATDETTGFLSVSVNFGAVNFNCSIDDSSSDFNVASNVSSATLHKTISADDPLCGGSLTSDVTVDIAWTGAGPIQTTKTTNQFSCSGYTDESQGSDSNNAGQATFNITGLGGPITTPDAQVFHFGSSFEHAQGAVPPDSCHASVGRGAGRPTPAAGNYHTTLQTADIFSSLFMFAGRNTTAANPLVGASTSTDQTSVQFSSPNGGGCFVIATSNFTLRAASASLHTSLTSGPNGCSGETNSIDPDPFAIDVSWVGTSPVATTRTQSQYSCLNYRFQTSVVQVAESVATATVSMPGFNATIPDAGPIGSVDTRTHAEGTPAPGCFFRG